MSDDWDFIDSWLDNVLSSQHLETLPLKSASISSQDSITSVAQQIVPPSPPSSIFPGRPSLKQKRRARSDSYNCDTMPSPRKRIRAQDDQPSITTATSAFSDIQLAPTAHSRSSSPTKVKATSSVRELRDIYRFASPPLKFATSVDENTPQYIIDMIHGLPLHGVGVIPSSLKEIIKATLPFEDIPDYAFNASTPDNHFTDQNLWRTATSILQRAKDCFIDNSSEGPWLVIANKFLEDVFAQPELEGMLCVMDIQYSDVSSATLLPHVNGTAIPTKKVDVALAISPHTPVTAPVYAALRTSDPTIQFSQMSEPSVSRLALPGCVEVGEPGKNYLEASLQLGVWCFAGLAKLDELKVRSGDYAATVDYSKVEQNLLVFGWTAIGMDWKLHIAYRDTTDNGVVILGPLDSGGLGSVMAFFKLFKTVTALAKWAKEKFWPEFRSIVEA
ncbi:hypothetical protein GP486_004648 [Trichoglossum hirsutum]|uniref:PD-(D/E)XK nuclease-like domain-containing protein n=1 Tax=Trichoglossum hirsutum TaxID=265104 RepID=A0A9P8LAH8_9PEZI|nr:hypothetical protein GP486_004648 [Trichoglossum hirsutum]